MLHICKDRYIVYGCGVPLADNTIKYSNKINYQFITCHVNNSQILLICLLGGPIGELRPDNI